MILKKANITKFRGLNNCEIDIQGKAINAIVGQNSTMKTTLLGLLSHPFSLKTSIMKDERTIDGLTFSSSMVEKFKFSDTFDIPGQHNWTLTVDRRINSDENFTCISEKRSDGHGWRFWSNRGREVGMGFLQCPVLYLSLKRLSPIGEEKKISIEPPQLTHEEIDLYTQWHSEILISLDTISDVDLLKSSHKRSLAPTTNYYESKSVSAGQDNVGKIITSILSMKRLQEKYPNDYVGSMIFIDEIESTFYPASQIKLIDFLFKVSKSYKIQFFFTTHSMTIIEYLKKHNESIKTNIIYLSKIDHNIKVTMNPSLPQIESDLNIKLKNPTIDEKIRVYCEDYIGMRFAKGLIPRKYHKNLTFINKNGSNLGWSNYKHFIDKKIPEFEENMIIIDGDAKSKWRNSDRYKNVIFLPTKFCPENAVFTILKDLPESDPFWGQELATYTKQLCFRDYPNLKSLDESQIKNWFLQQVSQNNKTYKNFTDLLPKYYPTECREFLETFEKELKVLLKKKGV